MTTWGEPKLGVICPQCGSVTGTGHHFCPVPMTAGTRPPHWGARDVGVALDQLFDRVQRLEDDRKTATAPRSRVEDGHGVGSTVEGAGDSRVDVRASEPESSSSTAERTGQNRAADLEAQARPPQTGPWKCLAEAESQRDAAIARAEAAEASKERVDLAWARLYARCEAERDAERERAGRLALYAKHQYGCGVDTKGGMFAPGPCTCGLSAAALALPASDTKENA